MFSCGTNYFATMPELPELPEITIYMNCDTRLAINLRLFDLSDKDEFIFVIKNYNYIDSDYVYLYRARKSDINEDGEIIFKITPEIAKQIKPGAFYNFSILVDAFDLQVPTEYKKLTKNGKIYLEYGAQDIMVKPVEGMVGYDNIESVKLEPISDETIESKPNLYASSRIVGLKVEEI